jgi:hypothetical protein
MYTSWRSDWWEILSNIHSFKYNYVQLAQIGSKCYITNCISRDDFANLFSQNANFKASSNLILQNKNFQNFVCREFATLQILSFRKISKGTS